LLSDRQLAHFDGAQAVASVAAGGNAAKILVLIQIIEFEP
jgi:hypothetical protein